MVGDRRGVLSCGFTKSTTHCTESCLCSTDDARRCKPCFASVFRRDTGKKGKSLWGLLLSASEFASIVLCCKNLNHCFIPDKMQICKIIFMCRNRPQQGRRDCIVSLVRKFQRTSGTTTASVESDITYMHAVPSPFSVITKTKKKPFLVTEWSSLACLKGS